MPTTDKATDAGPFATPPPSTPADALPGAKLRTQLDRLHRRRSGLRDESPSTPLSTFDHSRMTIDDGYHSDSPDQPDSDQLAEADFLVGLLSI